jgi:hypothetical protein
VLSGFPPEVRYLKPPIISIIKRAIPAKPKITVTIFLKIHSNPLIVATQFAVPPGQTTSPRLSLGALWAKYITLV